MKIIHAPSDIAEQAWIVSRAQKKLGFQSDVMVYRSNKYYNHEYEYNFHLEKVPVYLRKLVGSAIASFFVPKALAKYDVFHFHTKSVLPKCYDAILAKKLKKKIVFHIHGCEVRLSNHGDCQVCQYYGKKNKLRFIKTINEIADNIIIATPDLFDELPNAVWIPNCINPNEWKPGEKEKNGDKIKIVHVPTDRTVKGTAYIENTVESLKREGYNIELILIENVPREKLRAILLQADIAIDQLLIGAYGLMAIDTMALGIPTCAYIREDLIEKYPRGMPIFNVNKENILERLRILIEDQQLRKKLSKDSIKFVEENHDSKKNALRILKLYEDSGIDLQV